MSRPCKFGALLVDGSPLSLPDRNLLLDWVGNGRDGHGRAVAGRTISRALADIGVSVGKTLANEHRSGRCTCERTAV